MEAKGFFITGTDTGIGKTVVSSLLIRALVDKGYRVTGMKPLASGAIYIDGMLRNEDAISLIAQSNVAADYDLVNPYCFEPPVAPHIAAKFADIEIKTEVITQYFNQLADMSDMVVVEGVGGWSVPINDDLDMGDLCLQLDLPVIMVVGVRLGCINHALLTAQSIMAKGCKLTGWVANIVDKNTNAIDENIQTLINRLDAPLLATFPYFSSLQDIDITNVFEFQNLTLASV